MNLFVDYNKKYKCSEMTDRISGSSHCVVCAICRHPMYPKRILFRTIRNNGTVIFNFIGKGGHGCFIQQNGIIICKKCFDFIILNKDIIDSIGGIDDNKGVETIGDDFCDDVSETIVDGFGDSFGDSNFDEDHSIEKIDLDKHIIHDIFEDEMLDIIDTSLIHR